MAKTPHMFTVTSAIRQQVAQEMTKETGYAITADMVSYVKGSPWMNVYAAQFGDITVLCWVRPDGEYIVKCVCW